MAMLYANSHHCHVLAPKAWQKSFCTAVAWQANSERSQKIIEMNEVGQNLRNNSQQLNTKTQNHSLQNDNDFESQLQQKHYEETLYCVNYHLHHPPPTTTHIYDNRNKVVVVAKLIILTRFILITWLITHLLYLMYVIIITENKSPEEHISKNKFSEACFIFTAVILHVLSTYLYQCTYMFVGNKP